jgi:hypothetical protein
MQKRRKGRRKARGEEGEGGRAGRTMNRKGEGRGRDLRLKIGITRTKKSNNISVGKYWTKRETTKKSQWMMAFARAPIPGT